MRKALVLVFILVGMTLSGQSVKSFYIGKKIYDYHNNQIIRLVGANDLIGFRVGFAYFVSENFAKTINSLDSRSFEWHVYSAGPGVYSRPEQTITAHAVYDYETDLLKIVFTLRYSESAINWYVIEIEKKFIKEIL